MSMQTDQIHLDSLVKAPDCLGVAHIFLHPQAIYVLKKKKTRENEQEKVCLWPFSLF